MDQSLFAAAMAAVGGLLGLGADRLATRWPEHEPGVAPRGLGWRTLVVALGGAVLFGGLVLRWPDGRDLIAMLVFGTALVVLLATDLDQRLLPDLLTLPLIGYAAVALVLGFAPLLRGLELGLASGVAAAIGAPVLLMVSDRLLGGDLGGGDVKLAAAVGLWTGVTRFLTGFVVASVVFAALLIVLIAARRVGLRSAVPFGPVLIGAAAVAMLLA